MDTNTVSFEGYSHNPKPEMIIPTGSSYVLNEFYTGECVQIGGTKENTFMPITTDCYIKCKNDAGEIKFIRISLFTNNVKLILTPLIVFAEFEKQWGQTKRVMFDVNINTYFANEVASLDNVFGPTVTLEYNKDAEYVLPNLDSLLFALKDLQILTNNANIDVVDSVIPTYHYWEAICFNGR